MSTMRQQAAFSALARRHHASDSRWQTSEYERDASDRVHRNERQQGTTRVPAGTDCSATAPSMTRYLEALEADDESGWRSGDAAALDNASALSGSQAGAIFGPPPVHPLLPWLGAPGMKQTYLHDAEVARGRKERWVRVVSDTQSRRELVDLLWMYIADAETQRASLRRHATRLQRVARARNAEFTHWIQRMHEGDGDSGIDAFFEWPDPDAPALGAAGLQLSATRAGEPPSTSSSDAAATPSSGAAAAGMTDEAARAMLRDMHRHRGESGNIGDITALSAYEELPFLRRRLADDPGSLDPALKEWAQQHLGRDQPQPRRPGGDGSEEDRLQAGDEPLEAAGAATDANEAYDYRAEAPLSAATAAGGDAGGGAAGDFDTGSEQQPQQRQQADAAQAARQRRDERRAASKRAAAALYRPLRLRVSERRPTFDAEGCYFHVSPNALSAAAPGGSDDGAMPRMPSPDARPLRNFFRPRMVKARDSTHGPVVKIDWPTVRAAYGSKFKTDLSKEEVAAARERIIRLCRGEDPASM